MVLPTRISLIFFPSGTRYTFSHFSIQVSSPKVKQVFDTCRGVVRSDHNMSLYLLPHVAVQVLLDGSSEDHKEVDQLCVLRNIENIKIMLLL